MSLESAHIDRFVIERLPPDDLLPEFRFDRPELQYPERLNAAKVLLDDAVAEGHGDKVYLRHGDKAWTYRDMLETANRIANVLVDNLGLVPGNRVLLRGANTPMLVACWIATIKAGGIVATTMPLLRAGELAEIIDKGAITIALCEDALADDLKAAGMRTNSLQHFLTYDGYSSALNRQMESASPAFDTVDTSRDDPCMLAFTSGTTGQPKATVHFQRDVLAMCDAFARHILDPQQDDIFTGTPPIAFTFGLGALVVFPAYFRASAVHLPKTDPEMVLEAIERFAITRLFTAPTAYRAMLSHTEGHDLSGVRSFVSAGEALPKATSDDWFAATGKRIVDGIGSTEMMYIFISAREEDIHPGATGKAVPGYEACILDPDGQPLPAGRIGSLAVKGPTGCRYLDDPRQEDYVFDGWNITGDAYRMDEDGYFWFVSRADDLIVSSGYNISGIEVEHCLIGHDSVAECAVVGVPDDARGHIVKAFVVLAEPYEATEALIAELQRYVKSEIAPYKYPRAIEFVETLPKTQTGKIQRFRLRKREEGQ